MTYDSSLVALADPTRRAIYERLRQRPHSVGELAGRAAISQPAVSQHLRVLRGAKLVTFHQQGARRLYRADREGLADLRRYVEALWEDVLNAYADDSTPAPEET